MQMLATTIRQTLNGRHGFDELGELPRHHEVDEVGNENEPDEDRTTAGALAVVPARGSSVNARLRGGMWGLGHGPPYVGAADFHSSAVHKAVHLPIPSIVRQRRPPSFELDVFC